MSAGVSSGHHTSNSSAVQQQLKEDWANREIIQVISYHIKKITDFINQFDLTCRTKIATLNEKVNNLERKVEFLEARVTKGETLN